MSQIRRVNEEEFKEIFLENLYEEHHKIENEMVKRRYHLKDRFFYHNIHEIISRLGEKVFKSPKAKEKLIWRLKEMCGDDEDIDFEDAISLTERMFDDAAFREEILNEYYSVVKPAARLAYN